MCTKLVLQILLLLIAPVCSRALSLFTSRRSAGARNTRLYGAKKDSNVNILELISSSEYLAEHTPVSQLTSGIGRNDNVKDISTRRIFVASALMATSAVVGSKSIGVAEAAATLGEDYSADTSLQWEASPVNKRSGITVFEAEKRGYNVRFVTYLSRFLLCFDRDCQRWWYGRAASIPRTASEEEVNALRLKQFGSFAASVEVGLVGYGGPDGAKRLMKSLLERYCPDAESLKIARAAEGQPALNADAESRQQREIKESRRQIALLFGLMETNQPVEEITKILAAVDNATITTVTITDPGSGYAPGYESPRVTFPPPAAGEGFETATGSAILTPNGKILRLDLANRGFGYSQLPTVTISPPSEPGTNSTSSTATAKAFIFRQGENKGGLERIQLIDSGSGYKMGESINITISRPEIAASKGGVIATARAILELEVGEIKVTNAGSGYAAEKPVQVYVEPPPPTARISMNDPMNTQAISKTLKEVANNGYGGGDCIGRGCYDRAVVAITYPQSEKASYIQYRSDKDAETPQNFEAALKRRSGMSAKRLSGSSSGDDNSLPSLPSWGGGTSSSTQLLSLLPSGFGLAYDQNLNRYILVSGKTKVSLKGLSLIPLDPEFGPRGRSPIEREKQLDKSTFLRFVASGAICCSGVHAMLTPIDVIKTKVQTNPVKYPGFVSAFKTIASEDGPAAFYTGLAPTFLGFFINGATGYSLTEFLRRYFINLAGPASNSLEIPIILSASTIAAVIGSFTLAPCEAVRIRSVAQPDYADNIIGVFNRIVDEEGPGSLFSAVPAMIPKEVTFACAKFTVFFLSTQYLYDTFPAAREDLQLSLLVSLAGGTLGGISAAIVSNPADATISEMKKGKSDMGVVEAVKSLLDKGGVPFLFKGLGIRMFFFTLIVSLQFLVYDAIRFSLGIGQDDLKLYLDVLGGALREKGGPV